MRQWVAVGLACAALMAPAPARAYCRTTTVHEPVPYDPVQSGCWTQGKPLAWAAGQRIPYTLTKSPSASITLVEATHAVHLSFDTWNAASCNGSSPNVQAYDDGPISIDAAASDCGLHPCDPSVHDGLHVIVFDDASWPFDDPNNTLAMTTVTYGVDSGEIYDADVQINSWQHPISAVEPPQNGTYDLQSILTHEAGHFLGFAHATSTVPIMYAQYQPGHTQLTLDDEDAICTVYPPISGGGG
ncbi:MAG TPA: matrixin family metalloprotease, partial [Polyangiaceae bacterium]